MQKQDLGKLQLRKVKALKRKHDASGANGDSGKEGNEDEKEKLFSNDDFKRIKANVTKDKDE